ncbi:DNA topology modulation protein [Staphylococcus arlettae]|uniref:DNA topology modulation protein n=1 Tax=Staphylococcus arlettae TaxID=29378 RepID=UPI003515AA67
MKKVVVMGSSGSGKSTLCRTLASELQLPLYHLDVLFWKPQWIMTSEDEQEEILQNIIPKQSWIIDGSYSACLAERLSAEDTVIFLDLPRKICLFRIAKRLLQNLGKTRKDMGEGCKERFNLEFIKYIWDYPKKRKPYILNTIKQTVNQQNVHILTSPAAVKAFIVAKKIENEREN